MAIQIETYSQDDFLQLRTDWEQLQTGKEMTYFHYGYDEVHHEIVVISAGVMEGYERYSPGMILMQAYIEETINQKKIRVIDFTRGDEPYKLALGGIRKINNTVKFYYK